MPRMSSPAPQLRSEWLVVALCPAIAASELSINAMALGIAALLACTITFAVAALLKALPQDLRWLLSTLVLATLLGVIGLTMQAWMPDLHAALGVFLPLLVANLAIQQRAEEGSNGATAATATVNGLRTGAAMLIALLLLGLPRELVGRGSLLHDSVNLAGAWINSLNLQLFRADMGFLLAMLPPGAFIAFGMLLAARNWIAQRNA